ncbi:hypothetical protein [Streptomyces sp. NPDC059371]|uniref:hypothetical protein n=1 Tax=Streptomyces sp. NPDC059371 TaxID=3346812 RepID=UPI003675B67A
MARVRGIREVLGVGLTVEDLRRIADRIQLLAENPHPPCAGGDPDSPGSGVVERRPAAIDAEIGRLTRPHARLAQRTGQVCASPYAQRQRSRHALERMKPRRLAGS